MLRHGDKKALGPVEKLDATMLVEYNEQGRKWMVKRSERWLEHTLRAMTFHQG